MIVKGGLTYITFHERIVKVSQGQKNGSYTVGG